jgi:prephenate dehydratase
LVDFEGSDTDPVVTAALEKTKKISSGLKLLGCYVEKNIEESSRRAE